MKKCLIILILFSGLVSCVEEFDIDSELPSDIAEDVLVIEAELTNTLKYQKVTLSRGLSITRDSLINFVPKEVPNPNVPYNPYVRPISYEENASVMIKDQNGTEFNFSETTPGIYISDQVFQAQKDVGYQLMITTSDGIQYSSSEERFIGDAQIDDVYAIREFNDINEEGMSIYVDGSSASNATKYFRYEYEETYKIIAPKWSPREFRLTNYEPCALPLITYDLEIVEREEEARVCFNTVPSNRIIQTTTIGQSADEIVRFPVRFIKRDDFILTYRYSILVKQLIQSIEAYSYYQQLKSFTTSESLFSEIQPGFLEGNIKKANGDSNAKVLGYFEVASVTEKRIFFNYEDFFPNEELPPYPSKCFEQSSPESHASYCGPSGSGGCPQSVVARVDLDLISYVRPNFGEVGVCPGPHVFVTKICGDCTLLGSNIKPDFWVE